MYLQDKNFSFSQNDLLGACLVDVTVKIDFIDYSTKWKVTMYWDNLQVLHLDQCYVQNSHMTPNVQCKRIIITSELQLKYFTTPVFSK